MSAELTGVGDPADPRTVGCGSVIDAGLPVVDDALSGMADGATPDRRGVPLSLDGDGDGRADVDAGSVEAPAVAPAPGTGGVTPPAKPVHAQPDYTG